MVVASNSDLDSIRGKVGTRPIVLVEHGAGQTYSGAGAYSDGGDLRGCSLILAPGPYSLAKRRRFCPTVKIVMVGLLKLENLLAVREDGEEARRASDVPTVVFGWHWDCKTCPESRATWPRWIEAVAKMAADDMGWNVLGHAHPREWHRILPFYQEWGIQTVKRFDDAMAKADLYVVDNSSTAFEAAALGVPVLLLDSPVYQKARHGLRFGVEGAAFRHCSEPSLLHEACLKTHAESKTVVQAQYSVLDRVYSPALGGPAKAAEAIIELSTYYAAWKTRRKI